MTGIPEAITIIRRRKIYEDVAGRLEGLIHEGRYRPGDQLPSERELMQMFGVGRPAVREA
jgi:DNA-binding FadR family transcriptional regulator